MIAASAGTIAALKAFELGLATFEQVFKLIKDATEQNRDLTEEELNSIDASIEHTDNEWEAAKRRKAERDRN